MPILQVANVHHDKDGFTRTQISTANTVTWYTSNSEKLRLDLGGNLAIGRTATTYKLDVVGTANAGQFYINDTLVTAIANSYADIAAAGANAGTGFGANAYAQAVGAGANTGTGTAANLFSHNIGILANNRANAIGVGANTWSNTVFGYANTKFLANALVTFANNFVYTGNLAIYTPTVAAGNVSIGRPDTAKYKLDVFGTINCAQILVNEASLGSGGGDYNTNITNSLGYQLTTTLADVFTAPVTANKRYIVRSVHVTNIGSEEAYVTGDFQGTTYSAIAFANTIPVPVGSAVELLKKSKIMQPSDILRLQAEFNSTLHATIAYEIQTSTSYFGRGVTVTSDATYTDLYTATGNAVLESILLTNIDGAFDVKARVVWTNATNTIQGYYCYDLIIPADATVELLEAPKNLPSGFKVRVYANIGNRLETIIAGKVA